MAADGGRRREMVGDGGRSPALEDNEGVRVRQVVAHLRLAEKRPEAIRSDQKRPEAIRSHQKPSEAIRSHKKPSEAIRRHQNTDEITFGWPRSASVFGEVEG